MSDFQAKMHEIGFPLGLRPRRRWGSAPDAAGGACSAPPYTLAALNIAS